MDLDAHPSGLLTYWNPVRMNFLRSERIEARSEIEAGSEIEPDQKADPPEPESIHGERQMTHQSDRYTLRRRVTPPTRYQ